MFLNPLLLLGSAAVSVPIIIHLLNRRRFERVMWAAMRFVQVSMQQNQRRMQIEDLILLLIRCAMLLLLALALARPVVRGAAAFLGNTAVTAVVVLDNSASMSQTDDNVSRFDKGKRVAEQLISGLPSGSSVSVMLASDVVDQLIAEPTFELGYAKSKIADATIADRGTNMLPAIQKAIRNLQKQSSARKEIFVISDGQALGWKQTGDVRKVLDDAKADKIGAHLFFVGETAQRNLGIADLRMSSALAVANHTLRFDVQVGNYGRTEARDINVKLFLDEDRAPASETTLDIPAGATKSVALDVKPRTEGYHTIRAVLDPSPDHMPRDNTRVAVIRAIKQVQVLLVDGQPGREPRDAETFFLRGALQPVDPMQRDQFFIQAKVIAPPDLERERLDDYDALFLANVPDLPAATVGGLEKFVRDGRGLVIFPGTQINPTFYNDYLLKRYPLLPAAIGEPHGDANQAEKFITFDPKGLDHPIAALWADPGAGFIASPRFYRAFTLEPAPKPVEGASVDVGTPATVLRYSDGKPAVMERTYGLGRVVLFSSSADTEWNDLPVRPKVFIPLLHRVLGSLVARQDENLNIRVGQKFVLRTRVDLLGADAHFTRPGEAGKIQDSRRVELVGNAPLLTYDRTDYAGVYNVAIGANAGDGVKFAAQADPAESRLETISRDQLDTLRAAASVVQWQPGMAAADLVKREQVGAELWFYLAAVVVLLAGAETALAHWFSHSK